VTARRTLQRAWCHGGWRRVLLSALGVCAALGASVVLGMQAACSPSCCQGRKIVRVLAADALARSMERMEEAFERQNPDVDLRITVEGSVMLLRMHLLHPADFVILADSRLIEQGLRPDDADWLIAFATSEIVIARTEASRYAENVSQANWPEVLLAPNVTVGHADPAVDPCGYYTRLVWRLAELRYGTRYPNLAQRLAERSSAKYQRPDALSVLALLQARALDYAFVYRSHAADHHLPYVRLDDEINLGRPELAQAYGAAEVQVPDYRGKTVTMRGRPIFLGFTIARRAREPKGAERFAEFLLSKEGQAILERSEFQVLRPARAAAWSTRLPASLASLVVRE